MRGGRMYPTNLRPHLFHVRHMARSWPDREHHQPRQSCYSTEGVAAWLTQYDLLPPAYDPRYSSYISSHVASVED